MSAPVELRVLDDPAAAAAELIAEAARAGGDITLAGGSTVGPLPTAVGLSSRRTGAL